MTSYERRSCWFLKSTSCFRKGPLYSWYRYDVNVDRLRREIHGSLSQDNTMLTLLEWQSSHYQRAYKEGTSLSENTVSGREFSYLRRVGFTLISHIGHKESSYHDSGSGKSAYCSWRVGRGQGGERYEETKSVHWRWNVFGPGPRDAIRTAGPYILLSHRCKGVGTNVSCTKQTTPSLFAYRSRSRIFITKRAGEGCPWPGGGRVYEGCVRID